MEHNALAAWKGDGIHNMEREDVEVTLSEIGNAVHTHTNSMLRLTVFSSTLQGKEVLDTRVRRKVRLMQ